MAITRLEPLGVLLLLDLLLHLVELLDLLGHLRDGVHVLLLERGQRGLVLDGGLLEVATELGQLSLPLLVQLNLCKNKNDQLEIWSGKIV